MPLPYWLLVTEKYSHLIDNPRYSLGNSFIRENVSLRQFQDDLFIQNLNFITRQRDLISNLVLWPPSTAFIYFLCCSGVLFKMAFGLVLIDILSFSPSYFEWTLFIHQRYNTLHFKLQLNVWKAVSFDPWFFFDVP